MALGGGLLADHLIDVVHVNHVTSPRGMTKRNLTIQLDDSTVRSVRVLAARRSTSISRLVADEIERLVREDAGYERAAAVALNHLHRGYHLGGGRLPARSELHER
jgi:hypothetical protein